MSKLKKGDKVWFLLDSACEQIAADAIDYGNAIIEDIDENGIIESENETLQSDYCFKSKDELIDYMIKYWESKR